jgi:hypothetical protein
MLAPASDGTHRIRTPNFRVEIGQRPGELEVRAAVELPEPAEADLADRPRLDHATVRGRGTLHGGYDPMDVGGRDIPLVSRPDQGAAQLLRVERLAPSVALSHPETIDGHALEGGEPLTASGAFAAAPDGPAGVG